VPSEKAFELAQRELSVDEDTWFRQTHAMQPPSAAAGASDDDEGVLPSLQHVFTILTLALDREPLLLAMHGVASDDAAQRGTALEYLENVLPAEVRESLWARLGVTEPVSKTERSHKELISDLLRFRRALRG
jgi:hypothetical protein